MNFADQAMFAALMKRMDQLEKRVAELEAKRPPGRPAKDKEAA